MADQNTLPLATPADLVARYDVRRLADLISDSGVRVDVSQLTIEDTTPYNTLVTFLIDATHIILAASRVSCKYTLTQLYGDPTTTPPIPGSTLAKRLCCDLTYALLTGRRGYAGNDATQLTPRAAEAQQMLEALRRGDRIFDIYEKVNTEIRLIEDHAAAGLPKGYKLLPDDNPSLLTSNARLFGVRLPSSTLRIGW